MIFRRNTSIARLEARAAANELRMTLLEARATSLEATLDHLLGQVAMLSGRMSLLEAALVDTAARIEACEAGVRLARSTNGWPVK